jgi:undecaprenyl-diphosphatase
MLDYFLKLDFAIFSFINQGLSNPLFDFLLPLFRSKFFWIPLYLLIVVLLAVKLKWKSVFIVILMILTILITDKTSSELIKKTVCRTRPCNEASISSTIVKRVECGSGYSFTSTHAANHFALAYFFAIIVAPLLTVNKLRRRFFYFLFYFWAFSIAFSQVYVGVHYPSDVVVGALLGILLAALTYELFKQLIKIKLQ